jgi:hypothetical protein
VKEKILILVKTYPNISEKYGELTCTAGMKENGEWVRIYPIPFRYLKDEYRYKKYDILTAELIKRSSSPDKRSESHTIKNDTAGLPYEEIELDFSAGRLNTENNWKKRKEWVLKAKVYNSKKTMLDEFHYSERSFSLATFKPTEIIDFVWEYEGTEWDQTIKEKLEAHKKKGIDLFSGESSLRTVRELRKLPYKFFYKFKDSDGLISKSMIEDWEVGALYWQLKKDKTQSEADILKKVKIKFLDEFRTKDLYFFLGTTHSWHGRSKNPFIIIGVFYPPLIPENKQQLLF